jgi:hypothetical protein
MKNHCFYLKFTKNGDFFDFFTKIFKNQYFFKKIEKSVKNDENRKNLKLPMKFIENEKKAFTRLLVHVLAECTFRPKKLTLFLL